VAKLLAGAQIFLSTGFPEGYSLPPLEAMAAGCLVTGFSGFGGFEYMRNPENVPLSGLYLPPYTLPALPWGGNGLFVSDGDVLSAGRALAYAVRLFTDARENSPLASMLEAARAAAAAYAPERRAARARELWEGLESTGP
jgi:glycosyltransferase involved in cell wall biosynthesis